MRIIWNIVENSNAGSNLPGALKLIDELAEHRDDILEFLASDAKINSQFAQVQLKEECEKARQILAEDGNLRRRPDGKEWYKVIQDAEQYAFFHGCIRFLYRDADNTPEWGDFVIKFANAQQFFNPSGVKAPFSNEATLMRALLSRIKEWGNFWNWKYTPVNSVAVWRTALMKPELCDSVHSLLLQHDQIGEWLQSSSETLYQQNQPEDTEGIRVVNDLCKSYLLAANTLPADVQLRHVADGGNAYYYLKDSKGTRWPRCVFVNSKRNANLYNALSQGVISVADDSILRYIDKNGTELKIPFFMDVKKGWNIGFTVTKTGQKYIYCWNEVVTDEAGIKLGNWESFMAQFLK